MVNPRGTRSEGSQTFVSLTGSAAILCTGGLDMIRKEAWPFYITISGVRLCWELEPKGPNELDSRCKGLPGPVSRVMKEKKSAHS